LDALASLIEIFPVWAPAARPAGLTLTDTVPVPVPELGVALSQLLFASAGSARLLEDWEFR
jgi:hypothetical protein